MNLLISKIGDIQLNLVEKHFFAKQTIGILNRGWLMQMGKVRVENKEEKVISIGSSFFILNEI